MPTFVKLEEKDRVKLFTKTKENIGISWNKFHPTLNVGRAMFFNYLSGKNNIPKNIFLKLQEVSKIKIDNYKEINQNRNLRKEIKIPVMNKELAEILGVLNGDGYTSDIKYEISVVLSSLEEDYAFYLKNLFEKEFGISFKLLIQPGKIRLKTYSIELFKILTDKYGLPNGKKKGKLLIPKQVFRKKDWIASYIKGLFDTDGSFYMRRKNEPVVEISSADIKFLKEVKSTLLLLDLRMIEGTNKLTIYKKEDIGKFFHLVKPANSKHLKKFEITQNKALVV